MTLFKRISLLIKTKKPKEQTRKEFRQINKEVKKEIKLIKKYNK